MNKHSLTILLAVLIFQNNFCSAQKINRQEVVERHRVIVSEIDTLASLTVGNGKFAFTVDATGLQSFPEYYTNGVPLGTQSEWGWHKFINKQGYKFSETLKETNFNGNDKGLYAVQIKTGRGKNAADYFRENPSRLQLGNIGLELYKKDGSIALPTDLKNIHQTLNVYTGEIVSSFTVEGSLVKVITNAHASKDIIAAKINSTLLKDQRIKIKFRFPYPTNAFADMGTNYASASAHSTTLESSYRTAIFSRTLDNDHYYVSANWNEEAQVSKVAEHIYTLLPTTDTSFEIAVSFSKNKSPQQLLNFAAVATSSINGWKTFWQSGAAIDFAGSTDERANELERRIILSQYLTRVQCAGNFPPQETGLTYNSWYGRPHMEMYWWHSAHFAFWGRTALMEKSMQWYFKAFEGAKIIAKRQGFEGVRWQKMSDNEGGESPSNVGSFLLWQQPHIIYQAELLYKNNPSKQTLQKYQQLIFETANFMASYARLNPVTGKYDLGKGFIPAQECFNPAETFNAPYELAYWKWALQVAQTWRTRLGLPINKKWQNIIEQIAPMAQKDGVYQAAESVSDSYSAKSNYTIDHPAVLAALSTIPQNGYVDTAVMHRTFNMVEQAWHWEHTWGWDFPLVAMTATRLNLPNEAIDALFKNIQTNTYLINGHNYQNKRLTLYLPGNGGLLSAIALMCAGYEGNTIENPGFPKNGKWKIKWEGLKPLF